MKIHSSTQKLALSQNGARGAKGTINLNALLSTLYVCDTGVIHRPLCRLPRSTAHAPDAVNASSAESIALPTSIWLCGFVLAPILESLFRINRSMANWCGFFARLTARI